MDFTFETVDFLTAWNMAWNGNVFLAIRKEGRDEDICGAMSLHNDGKVWIAAHDEVGNVAYRQKFTRERYARARDFLAKRYLSDDDNVSWYDLEND